MRNAVVGTILSGAIVAACAAVYPEFQTAVREPRPGQVTDPAPPEDLVFIRVAEGKIPPRAPDGRAWDGDQAPDPFVRLYVDGRELMRTPVESNTREPTWPDQGGGNYRLPRGAQATLELWDSNAVTNSAICVQKIGDLHRALEEGELTVQCKSGARVRLIVMQATPKFGLGLSYSVGAGGRVAITRVAPESPASRAGLSSGDGIERIMGKDVASMEEGEAQSLINANSKLGLELVVSTSGKARELTLREGPIYAIKSWQSGGEN